MAATNRSVAAVGGASIAGRTPRSARYMRASAAYRLQVVQNLLRRAWLETRAEDRLPESAVNVWSREVHA